MSVHYEKGNAVHRKPFIGDPAAIPYIVPEIGSSVRQNKPGYKANKEARAKQGSPAKKAVPRKPGPTHRGKGISRANWCAIMDGKV